MLLDNTTLQAIVAAVTTRVMEELSKLPSGEREGRTVEEKEGRTVEEKEGRTVEQVEREGRTVEEVKRAGEERTAQRTLHCKNRCVILTY